MPINYKPVGWDTTKYVNPTNMNQMDNGIKAACDGVDALTEEVADVNESLGKLQFQDLGEVENLDNLVEYGHYAAKCNNASAVPDTGFLNVIVMPYDGNTKYPQQILTSLSSGRMYTRRISTAGAWSPWDGVVLNSDLETKSYNASITNGQFTRCILKRSGNVVTLSAHFLANSDSVTITINDKSICPSDFIDFGVFGTTHFTRSAVGADGVISMRYLKASETYNFNVSWMID